MRKIYKYVMPVADHMTVNCVKLVRVGSDGGETPTIWVEHGREETLEHVWKFAFFGTGHSIPDDAGDHVGSARCGPYVWHVYGKIVG